jgi:hypothetical protein
MAAAPSITTFVAGDPIESAPVNANFSNLASWLTTNAVTADGTVPFTVPPQCSATPSIDDHLTRKAYVDVLSKSRTGYETFLATPANVTFSSGGGVTTLATVASDNAVPINTTNTGLVLVATASCEIVGANGNASFLGTLEVSFDNGTTWETARRVNATAVAVGSDPGGYGSLCVQTFAKKATYSTASVVKARFLAVQRSTNTNLYSAQNIQLALEVRREVPLA